MFNRKTIAVTKDDGGKPGKWDGADTKGDLVYRHLIFYLLERV